MIYLIFLIVSCIILKTLGQYKEANYHNTLLYCFPILLFWSILIGGQYGVGTDYFSYYEIFNGNLRYVEDIREEYGFSYLVRFLNNINLYGQAIFIVIALIWVILLFYIMKTGVSNKYLYIFFFIFIVFSGIFNNQMNGIRQYLAVYILTFGYCLWLNNKKKFGILFIITSVLFHTSAAIFIPIFLIYVLLYKKFYNKTFFLSILIIAIISCFYLNTSIFDRILPFFSTYEHYLNYNVIFERSIMLKITKLWYVPIFLLAIYHLNNYKFNSIERKLFFLGIIGFSMKLALSSIGLVSRFSEYMEFFSCFPLVYLIVYLIQQKKTLQQLFIYLYLLAPYALKVLFFPKGEYLYSFYLFN